MSEFKVEKGMYWDITEFEGSQREALGFIIPKLVKNTDLHLESLLMPDDELIDSNGVFYQPSCNWRFIGVNLHGKILVDDRDHEDNDPVFTSRQSWDVFSGVVETQPTELEEAYAKIDTLESALEDAVKELISLREGNNPALIDVKEGEFKLTENELQFKPISEMTLGDWELAKEEGWVFELNNGKEVFVKGIMCDYKDSNHPVELNYLQDDTHECTVTIQGHFYLGNPEHSSSVKQRIK